MSRVVSLESHRPPARHDGVAWTGVRIMEADDPTSDESWDEAEVIAFEDLDSNSSKPKLRSFTTDASEKKWLRLNWLDDDSNEAIGATVFTEGPAFRPIATDVSGVMRSRTYSDGQADDPMGTQRGVFGTDTNPTLEAVERDFLTQAADHLLLETGQIPGEYIDRARQVATLRAAAEIERSYVAQQAEGTPSIYQTLRMTYEAEAKTLVERLQWWVLANRDWNANASPG